MRIISSFLSLLTLAIVSIQCKSVGRYDLQEVSLHTNRFNAKIEKAELLSYVVSNNDGESPTNEDSFQKIISEIRKEIAEFKSNPASFAMDGSWNIESGHLSTFQDEIQMQVMYSLKFLEGLGIYAAYKKMGVLNIEVPEQTFADQTGELQGHIKIIWSAAFPLQVDKGRDIESNIEAWMPLSSNRQYINKILTEYELCIAPDHAKQTDPEKFFGNFEIKYCNFADLNAKFQRFDNQLILIAPQDSSVGRPDPEYCRMWEDKILHATIFFGRSLPNDPDAPKDQGKQAYIDFINKITSDKNFENLSNSGQSAHNRNIRFVYNGPIKQNAVCKADARRKVSLQVVHSKTIGDIPNAEIAELIFGEQIKVSDYFMYNGHAGSGSNIVHLEKILDQNPGQYTLLHVNGCYTYSYSSTDNPNIDIIVNAKPSYFPDMADTAYKTFKGLLAGETFLELLAHSPDGNRAILLGEDVESIPSKQ